MCASHVVNASHTFRSQIAVEYSVEVDTHNTLRRIIHNMYAIFNRPDIIYSLEICVCLCICELRTFIYFITSCLLFTFFTEIYMMASFVMRNNHPAQHIQSNTIYIYIYHIRNNAAEEEIKNKYDAI